MEIFKSDDCCVEQRGGVDHRRGMQVIGGILVGQKDVYALRNDSFAQGLDMFVGIANPSEVEKWQWEPCKRGQPGRWPRLV